MKKQKTRKEPESLLPEWLWLLLFFILLVTTMTFLDKYTDTKDQLSDCQEQIPVWTLEWKCFDVFVYSDTYGEYIYMSYNFSNYDEYIEWKDKIERTKKGEHSFCEVIE